MRVLAQVYDSYPLAEQIARELEAIGVPARDISMLAKREINENLGRAGRGLLGALGLILIPGLGSAFATGWLEGSAVDGLEAALVSAGIGEDAARRLAHGVRHGGTLVAVHSGLATVDGILERHRAIRCTDRLSREPDAVRYGRRDVASNGGPRP